MDDRIVRKPDHVVMCELDGEAVLLNLRTDKYFGLDEVGTRIWVELAANASVENACEVLQKELDVEPAMLRGDIEALVVRLVETGLLERAAHPDEPLPAGAPLASRTV